VQYVITGSTGGVANAMWNNCEDGFLWYITNTLMNITNMGEARLVAFVVFPFIVALVGLYFVEGKVRLQP
jgi:hypothetical protein